MRFIDFRSNRRRRTTTATCADGSHGEFARLAGPLISCEAVLAETSHLIGRAGGRLDFIFEAMRRGQLLCPFRLEDEVDSVHGLLNRYSDVPMSLADACLVRMAELYGSSPVTNARSGVLGVPQERQAGDPAHLAQAGC